jgi:hypothetical protein
MEKQGVIAPGVTPPLDGNTEPNEKTSAAKAVNILDADFRKKAAETAAKTTTK